MSHFLKNVSKIASRVPAVNHFQDLVELLDIVFTLIPQHEDINMSSDLNPDDIGETFKKFQNREAFGWCHANANFMHFVLREYSRESYVYDFGVQGGRITHAVLVVTLGKNRFLIDPYFNRYYGDEKGGVYTFDNLIGLIKKDPSLIYSHFGKGKKPIFQGGKFIELTGQEFEVSVLEGWRVNFDLENVLRNAFGDTNPLNLISRKVQCSTALRKRNGNTFYEFW